MSLTIWGLPRMTEWLTVEPVRRRLWDQQKLVRKVQIEFDESGEETGNSDSGKREGWMPDFMTRKKRKAKAKPTFSPGARITGHVIISFNKAVTVTGLDLIFGGAYLVQWLDGNTHAKWAAVESIFTERTVVFENTTLSLTPGKFIFEFTYQLPDYLPPMLKDNRAVGEYFVYAKIHLDHGLVHVQSLDVPYEIRTVLDIGRVPSVLHKEVELSKSMRVPQKHPRLLIDVPVKLRLNKKAFCHGEHILADVTVNNNLNEAIKVTLHFRKIMTLRADHAVVPVNMLEGRIETPDYSRDKTLIVRSDLGNPMKVKIGGNTTDSFSCMFDVLTDTPSFVRKRPVSDRTLEMMVKCSMPVEVQYEISLEVKNLWDSSTHREFCVPLVIGTKNTPSENTSSQRGNLLYVPFLGQDFYTRRSEQERSTTRTSQPAEPYISPPSYEESVF